MAFFVPHLRPILSLPLLQDTPWLHGQLSRDDVTVMMQDHGMHEGLFLVRESQKRAGDYVLSVYNLGKIQHFIITVSA
jgi:hypothetical protein